MCLRAGDGGGGGLPFTGWEILLRKTIAIFRVMCVCVRMNYKAGGLISDRNTFSFRVQ